MTKPIGLVRRDKAARLIVHTRAFKFLNQATRPSCSTDLAGQLVVWTRLNTALVKPFVRLTKIQEFDTLFSLRFYYFTLTWHTFLVRFFNIDGTISKFVAVLRCMRHITPGENHTRELGTNTTRNELLKYWWVFSPAFSDGKLQNPSLVGKKNPYLVEKKIVRRLQKSAGVLHDNTGIKLKVFLGGIRICGSYAN